MHTDQGVYTINNIFYDTRLGTDKRCSVTDMPTSKNSEQCGPSEERSFKLLSSRKGKFAFAVDFFITVTVIAVLLLIEFGIFPHHQGGFYCKDPKLSFDFQGDTITISTLLITVYFVPLTVVTAVEWKSCKRVMNELFRRIWCWYKEFLLGMTILLVLVEFIKVIVGEPRPHFFATCQPNTALNCTPGYIPSYICTNKVDKSWLVSDSAKSFPSGHAAMSVFAAIYCVWYLQCCFPKLLCKLFKPTLQTSLLVASALCSLSRITDHRHHWWDVLAGTVLGVICVVYTIVVLSKNFKRQSPLPPRSSQSTCTLLTDTTNKNATSVIL